jgi:hypothetical protein
MRIVPYETKEDLLANIAERVIGPTERRLAVGNNGVVVAKGHDLRDVNREGVAPRDSDAKWHPGYVHRILSR